MNFKKIFNNDEFGYYEKRLCILLFFATIPNSYPAFQPLIIQYTPPHFCDLQSVIANTTEKAESMGIDTSGNWSESLLNYLIPWERDDLGIEHRSSCKRYNVSSVPTQFGEREILFTSSLAFSNHNFPGHHHNRSESAIIPCEAIYYNSSAISATTEFGMVCEKAWQKPFFISLVMAGNVVGGLLGGYLSDKYGRRKIFLYFTAWQFVISVTMSFSNNIVFYGIMMVLTGIGSLINFMAAVLIGVEVVGPNQRAFAYLVVEMGFCLGIILMAPLMHFFEDWRWFLRAVGFIGVAYIPYIWWIDETPYWLIATGKVKEAETVLKKIAKMNKKAAKIEEVEEITLKVKQCGSSDSWKTCQSVLSNSVLLTRIIIVSASWAVVNVTYYAIALNTNSLSGSRVLNLFYSGLTEVAATALFFLFAESRGRRNSYIGCMLACSISVAVTPFIVLWDERIVVATTMFSRLVVTIAFNVIYVYTGELFPTKARQSLFGIASASARIGGIISPYLIYAGEEGNTLAPSLGCAAVTFLSAISYVILPETKGKPLPQTVIEAINMKGALQPKCCLESNTTKQKNEDIPLSPERSHLCKVEENDA